MTARMEKVREFIERSSSPLFDRGERAARAEVEEWEANRAKTEGFVNDWGAESLANLRRAEAAEADADLVHETATIRAATLQAAHAANMKAAEAEADRLKAALTEYGDHQSWRCGHPDRYSQDPDCCCGLVQTWRDLGFSVEYDAEGRAALAPADRNTT